MVDRNCSQSVIVERFVATRRNLYIVGRAVAAARVLEGSGVAHTLRTRVLEGSGVVNTLKTQVLEGS